MAVAVGHRPSVWTSVYTVPSTIVKDENQFGNILETPSDRL